MMISEEKMVRGVSNALSIMEFTQGGKVACHVAEELLLLATAQIWRTGGSEHASECLQAMLDEMAEQETK